MWCEKELICILFLLLFGSYSIFFFTVSFGVFKLQNIGEFLPLFIITFLLLIAVINISVLVASFFHRKIVALQFLTLTSYPIFLISGYSWPYSLLPTYVKVFANILPSTPYFGAFTRITQMGAGVFDVLPEIIHLLLITIIGNVLAYYRIKYLSNKSNGAEMSPQIINQ